MWLYPILLYLDFYPLLNACMKGHLKIFCRCQDTVFRFSKEDFYNPKKVSDVKYFKRSAKNEKGNWCLMISPYTLPTPIQDNFWQVYKKLQAWCAQRDHYYLERVHKSHQKGAALYFHEKYGIQRPWVELH